MTPALAAPPRHEGETIWWRTSGAAVVEFNRERCAMLLYNSQNAFVFTWRRSGTTLSVEDNAGGFPSSRKIPAAVQIGTTWLGNPAHAGELNLTATGDNVFRAIALTQPAEPLLAETRSIKLRLAMGDVQMRVNHGKMPALLRAVKKCRRVIR